MNNITLGQYVEKDSLIHKLDPRTKMISLIVLMVSIFFIPSPLQEAYPYLPFIGLLVYFVFLLSVVLLTKIPVVKYLKSMKQIMFLMLFTFVIQILSPSGDNHNTVLDVPMHISIINILIVVLIFVLFFLLRKLLKFKLLIFMGLLCLSVYILSLKIGTSFATPTLKVYETGLYNGSFFVIRIFLVIMMSTILTLTTKPTDLTYALEWLLHPLTYLKINISIFAMLISLALRFVPTLFNESQKILKSQSSRGVDFKEGNLKSQINQIISLLIPMFVISYKRALDLADAMEARGYIPGAKRSKLTVMHFKLSDYIGLLLTTFMIVFVVLWRIY